MTGFDSKRQAAMDKLVAIQEELGMYDDQKPEQEPVAWGFRHHDGAIYDCISPEAHADCEGEYNVPLYDAPPKRTWVGLTDEDTFKIGERLGLADVAWIDLMKAIEAALRSKNT